MSMLSSGIKKVKGAVKGARKALHLPAFTPGNIITKYAPAAVALGAGGPLAAGISKIPGGAAVLKAGSAAQAAGGMRAQPRALPTGTFPSLPTFAGGNPISAGGAATPEATGENWLQTLIGGAGTALGKAGGYIKDNPLDVALGGLAVAQGVNSAKAAAQQGKYSDAAVKGAEARWAAQAPLRQQGIQRALSPKTFDYSSVYTDPQNPFAAGMRKPLTPPTARIPSGAVPAVPTRPAGPPASRIPAGPTAAKRPLLLPKRPKLLLPRPSY